MKAVVIYVGTDAQIFNAQLAFEMFELEIRNEDWNW